MEIIIESIFNFNEIISCGCDSDYCYCDCDNCGCDDKDGCQGDGYVPNGECYVGA